MFTFLHTYSPQPVLVSLGSINIYWYGLFIALGALAAVCAGIWLGKKYDIKKEVVIDLAFWLIIFGLIGARLYDVLLESPYYLNKPLDIFKIWQGGLAIHGGIIVGLLTLYIFSRKKKINFWLLAGIATTSLALGQAIGRWGNYFNQELVGLPTNLPWGIPIDFINRPAGYLTYNYFHPAFLYESLGNLVVFGILIAAHLWTIKNHNLKTAGYKPARAGRLLVIGYFILYSLLRLNLEFIRLDYAPVLFGWRWPQIMSLFLIIISFLFGLYIIWGRRSNLNN